jgi:hypothetical protein
MRSASVTILTDGLLFLVVWREQMVMAFKSKSADQHYVTEGSAQA